MDKLTVNEFEEIKRKMNDIYLNARVEYDDSANTKDKYLELQNRLINSDLSLIPAKLWDGIRILREHDSLLSISNYGDDIERFIDFIGEANISYVLQNHFDVFMFSIRYINNLVYDANTNEDRKIDATISFKDAFRKEIKKMLYDNPHYMEYDDDGNLDIPADLKSLNFKILPSDQVLDGILKYGEDAFFINPHQTQLDILENCNLDYLRNFNIDTKNSDTLGYIDYIKSKEENYRVYLFLDTLKNYIRKNGTYQEFLDDVAEALNDQRTYGRFQRFPSYENIEGPFREKYPSIFIDKDAPDELKEEFYHGLIKPGLLNKHKDWVNYLVDKDLSKVIYCTDIHLFNEKNIFIKRYISRFGNIATLKLFTDYGSFLEDMRDFKFKGSTKEDIDAAIEEYVIKKIKQRKKYRFLEENSSFVEKHPELFLDLSNSNFSEDEKIHYTDLFYEHSITFGDIYNNSVLVEILKNKNLNICLQNGNYKVISNLIKVLGNEQFLYLCKKYGSYLDLIGRRDFKLEKNGDLYTLNAYTYQLSNITFEHFQKEIENVIVEDIMNGYAKYNADTDLGFLKRDYKELFIPSNLPTELIDAFYGSNFNFELLKKYSNYLEHLKGTYLNAALIRGAVIQSNMREYLDLFRDDAIKLGTRYPDTVTKLIDNNQISLLMHWYKKTKGQFLPSIVVMQNFDTDEIDKFLSNSNKWSNLVKKTNIANSEEKDALLKLAYTFGVFDNNESGYNKLRSLLTEAPTHLESKYSSIESYFASIENPEKGNKADNVEIKEIVYATLKFVLKKENYAFDDNKPLLEQIYHKNKDGSYTLLLDNKKYPRSIMCIRDILKRITPSPIIAKSSIHRMFGRFNMQYDPDFTKFFLNNLESIINDEKVSKNIANIQRQFFDIKAINSNRYLTMDLAISYVENNKYENIQVGNENLAVVSQIAGYSQNDVNTLQDIYNYGKQRVFSSIPRVESTYLDYEYEILRLDDPLALAIGTLTDCCQALGDAAESCMQHSMVSKDGRVFVVKDKEGNIIAQSWVWRNGNTLCFDNIEVPDRQMRASGVKRGHEDDGIRNDFTDKVLEVYKKCAKELMEIDKKKYLELLDKGIITKEDYDRMVLKKVTIGEGYSNIKGSFSTLKKDSNIQRPLPYNLKIALNNGLYTDDSIKQYVLEDSGKDKSFIINNFYIDNDIHREYNDKFKKEDKSFVKNNLYIHNDIYKEYNDNNFKASDLFRLKKLESLNDNEYSNIDIDTSGSNHIISDIAYNYNLNPNNTHIIMHPNFAIIYEVSNEEVKIADLFFNTKVIINNKDMDITDIVAMQLRLAINQISSGCKINVTSLDDEQLKMYKKAMDLKDEIDIERGIKDGK